MSYLPLKNSHELKAPFKSYCNDASAFLETANEEQLSVYTRAFEEYLLFKHKTRVEFQIMEANRVGCDRNMESIIKNTASQVGLQMPKEYDHEK